MAEPKYVSPKDVKVRWLLPTPIPATDDQLFGLIADAEDVITQNLPRIDEWIAQELIPVDRVKRVAARMIIRQLKNPEGARQRQETQGPFTGTVTIAGDHPGELYMTDADRFELTPESVRGTRGRAFTVMPVGRVSYG